MHRHESHVQWQTAAVQPAGAHIFADSHHPEGRCFLGVVPLSVPGLHSMQLQTLSMQHCVSSEQDLP